MADPLPFAALDGRPLHGSVFGGERPQGVVVVFAALGVPARYYARFAAYLADHHLAALTFDYRGVATSRDRPLRDDPATLHDWATLDASAAIDAARARFPGLPVFGLGHSFGGQSFGLNPRTPGLDGIVVIGAGSGDFSNYPIRERWGFNLALSLAPLLGATFGYVPGRLGLGEDLPTGVVTQWTRWCRTPGYYTRAPEAGALVADRFPGPALFIDLPGDTYAPPAPAAALRSWFTAAKVQHRTVSAAELPASARGHFGAFRKGGEPIWAEIAAFCLSHTRG